MNIEKIYTELEADLRASLPGATLNWGNKDIGLGVRFIIDPKGLTGKNFKFYLTVNGTNCFTNKDFIKLAQLEEMVFTLLPFCVKENQKTPKQLKSCKYYVQLHDTDADTEKKETTNYTRRFLLMCQAGE